jgi:hypothetical protein
LIAATLGKHAMPYAPTKTFHGPVPSAAVSTTARRSPAMR